MWSPAAVGAALRSRRRPASTPLEPWREYVTIVSNTDVRNAEAFETPEIGGDHFRSSAVFLTQAHPKQTKGSNVHAGTSLDQHYAQQFGQETPIPSMQLCIESVDQAGGCSYGYSCVYTDTISWASPNAAAADDSRPALRVRSAVRRRRHARGACRAAAGGPQHPRLDHGGGRRGSASTLGAADRARLSDYLDDVREIERRIQLVEAQNSSGEQRELPGAPIGVPDSFSEHVKLMFDLQALAFASDMTRVFSFKLGRDASNRAYPESGVTAAFHPASHHGEREERIVDFAKINTYHVSMIPYFLEKLKNTPDGDSNLLENTLVIYGSPMGNSNVHNHKRCPLFLAGHAGGMLKGNLHLKAPDGTPMANVLLTAAARPRRRRDREHRRQHGRVRSHERDVARPSGPRPGLADDLAHRRGEL